ncbi:MAG: glycoside hydrolase family 97 catalytic domain-containing protein [Sedimentisphaerales bacterium]|nr:glycoside hydrolase family 97 catalytic domain-containing protein [Sedimentisphaerales bacterium]
MNLKINLPAVRLAGRILAVIAVINSMVLAMSSGFQAKSPNKELKLDFQLKEGRPVYSVKLGKDVILEDSSLGLVRSDSDFTHDLEVTDISKIKAVSQEYSLLHGKRSNIKHKANQRIVTLQNLQQQQMKIVFQVSDDGVAFRYEFEGSDDSGKLSINSEVTGFAFPEETKAWLHPLHDSKTGWSRGYPSYESHYVIEQPVGQPSPYAAGWAFPALFKVGQTGWVLLSETNTGKSYCGCRLGQDSTGGVYRIAFPQAAEHRGPIDPVAPSINLPFESPWRIVIIGKQLKTIVESTMATDLAEPSKITDTSFIKPGRAGWSWLRFGDNSAELKMQHNYLDMTAKLGWEYLLVDCNWDKLIGYEKIAEFAKEAKEKGVGLILWYNSNGEWNDFAMTPMNRVHTSQLRNEEFKRLKDMGIAGVKVDFFGGDKQATMQLYLDILEDAAKYNLMVNFHGATIPRGWQRTWPNMVTTEAVMGMEYVTFDQKNADQQPQHCCVLPFTRNVVAPMDFTPVVMNRRIRNVQRVTSGAFELALPVIFESGVQHFGLAPFEAEKLPQQVTQYLKTIPTAWDQTCFVAGCPAKDVVIARRKADAWYIAGINGEKEKKKLDLDLSFLPKGLNGTLITDDPAEDKLLIKDINISPDKVFNIELAPYGGFVIRCK